MIEGRIPGTGHLQRIVFNEADEMRRERLLEELQQRIRYVLQGPDNLLYLLTDSADGALLRMQPATAEEAALFSQASTSMALVQRELSDEALVQDYAACHRTETSLLGPSWLQIAER